MADPIIPNGIRAQLILQGKSGLPEDRFVTTWAFLRGTGVSYEDAAPLVAQTMDGFMMGTRDSGRDLESYLSPAVKTGTGAVIVKTYDLGQPPPREPDEFLLDIVAAPSSSNGIPAEVAVCGSFYSFRNLPRSRGRIYWGPFNTGVLMNGTNGRVKPDTVFVDTLAQSLDAVKTQSQATGLTWCILSQRDAELKPVTNGWVDDAFDTQRRRGEEPISRVEWGTALP